MHESFADDKQMTSTSEGKEKRPLGAPMRAAAGLWRSWRRPVGMLLGSYLGVIVVLWLLENWLVYRPTLESEDWQPAPSPEVTDVTLSTSGGPAIHAWWWPMRGAPMRGAPMRGARRGGPGGALLYCHGNAGNLSHRGPSIARMRQVLGESMLIFDYPGYGKSQGRPGEQGCYQAADAAYDWLVHNQKIDPEAIILYGASLGGGVAMDLASRKKHRALVLVNSFTSLPDVGQNHYPWLPVRWVMRNRFDNLGKIGKCRQPVFIIHGTSDQLIPFDQGRRLFEAASQPKQFFPIDGGDHNDPLPLACLEKLRDFLAETAHANSRGRPQAAKD